MHCNVKDKDKIIGIIDSHIQTAVSVSQILDYAGYKTFQAYNEEDARNKIIRFKPCLLIISSSFIEDKTCTWIKEVSEYKVIVILMSHEGKTPCNIKNIVATITKPIDSEKLLDKIKNALA
jgi:DNA-binding NtrC family response regulator